MSKSTTNALTSALLEYLLRLPGCFAWRQNTAGVFDLARQLYRPAPKRGVCDIIALYRGRFVGIEVKTGKDRLRPEQKSFIASIERAGGSVIVASSYEQFIKEWNAKTGR
jgi:hypothetical protein